MLHADLTDLSWERPSLRKATAGKPDRRRTHDDLPGLQRDSHGKPLLPIDDAAIYVRPSDS